MLNLYTVLDLTDERGEIGPMLMGDLGADIIKVELPHTPRERTLAFQAFNRNKRSVVIDPQTDTATLDALIERSDFIFDSWPDGPLAKLGHDFESVRALNPRIVYVRISAFGSEGPHAEYAASDLTIAAMGGPVAIQGVASRAPVRLSVPQVWRHAGAEAAAGAMLAHHRMLRTGDAQFVDLSAQSAMTWTMLNAMDAYAIQGFDFERRGGLHSTGTNVIKLIYTCADGYVLALPSSKVLLGCLPWMIEEGIASEALFETDWEAYDLTMRDPGANPLTVNDGAELLGTFFAKQSKQALYDYGLANQVTLAPINTLGELLNLEQLSVRDYWRSLSTPDGQVVRTPGLWAKPLGAKLSVRSDAPKTPGEHTDQLLAELGNPAPEKVFPENANSALPFDGLVVADFSWVGVGPISTKFLADHGAHVIRIESEMRPDVLRAGVPFKDDEFGIDRSQFFGDFNTSKQSISLDLKNPQAIEIAKQIIARADVMVESFAPGAIERMGLGYDEVKKLNPSIIMVSTCLMGQSGPAAQLAGYGYHAGAIAGFYEITGWPDLPPNGPWIAYTDTVAPRFISLLLASALDHRRRTGEGNFFDVAQIETALHFLAPELLDLQVNGISATRIGNRSTTAAPQGCYPCEGEDRWCAIAVETDEQWQALCHAMGRHDLADNPALVHHDGRLANHDELDAEISAWTASQDAYELMHFLQEKHVPAGVVQRSSDLLADPQYQHRGFYRYLDHPVMGNIPYAGHQYRVSGYDNGPREPAPMLGQHGYQVLSELLGMNDEDIADAYASGAVS